ncbi:MAG: ribonuclease H-like YkuK family protein [Candidatus Nealsonbacteria bacterium]
MANILQGHFYNPTIGELKFNQVIDEIFNYIELKPESFYDIIVGCDSSSQENPQFPVAIVVLRVGEGGRIFLKKINYNNRRFYSLKERILEEVLISCELSLELREALNQRIQGINKNYNYQFRYIHADIGENGDTKNMIKEVVGLIKGNGFEAKIKPEAYVASTVADRYT